MMGRLSKSRNRGRAAIAAVLILACSAVRARSDEPPLSGRPAQFSGITGIVHIEAEAAPTTVTAESPLVYTLALSGNQALKDLKAPNLAILRPFDSRFAIRFLRDQWFPEKNLHRFDYELRPRTATVAEIPPFSFVYYVPGMVPPQRGYQTRFTKTIPIRVTPQPIVSSTSLELVGGRKPIVQPETRIRLDEALANPADNLWEPRGPILMLLVLLPPGLALLWAFGISSFWTSRNTNSLDLLARDLSHAVREVAPDSAQVGVQLRQALEPFREQLARGLPDSEGSPCGATRFVQACQAILYAPPDMIFMRALLDHAAKYRRGQHEEK